MKEEREPADYPADILEAAGKISRFVEGLTFEQFCKDEKTIFAVIRGLEIIGEAVRHTPPPLRQKYPQISWRLITGMRDRLIHDYLGVDLIIVWNAATKELPAVKPKIREMLNEIGG